MRGHNQSSERSKKLLRSESQVSTTLLYGLNDNPPWYECIWLGLQQCFISATSMALVPILLGQHMCMFDNEEGHLAKTKFTSGLFFTSGVVTLLQSSLGTRLPILQGPTFTLIPPVIAVLSLPQNKCPSPLTNSTSTNDSSMMYNDTDGFLVDGEELWQRRMREIQGSLAVASMFEVLIGITGATRLMMRFIGPLTIAPSIALIGLDLFAEAATQTSGHWGVAIFTIALLTIFSQYLHNVSLPIPMYNRKRRCHIKYTKPFGIFAVLIAIFMGWCFCHILTIHGNLSTNSNETGYAARTDIKLDAITESPWFYIPYPGHMGMPTVSGAGVIAMIVAVLAGAVESIGDYHACAKLVEAPPPPSHVIARGITVEGIGCVFAGLISGSGSTSFSNNIAAIGITKVASRRVMIIAGMILMLMGMFCKFGAIFVMFPSPVLGGVFCVSFGIIAAIGLSMLQFVNMNLPRNQYVLGMSMFMGLVIPEWMKGNPGAIQTGVAIIDQTLTVLLTTAIFVGGVMAAILDNTMPGTLKDRGIVDWKRNSVSSDNPTTLGGSCYDLPFSTDFKIARYIPIFAQHGEKKPKGDRNGFVTADEERVVETDC